jgi:hypothetical protein
MIVVGVASDTAAVVVFAGVVVGIVGTVGTVGIVGIGATCIVPFLSIVAIVGGIAGVLVVGIVVAEPGLLVAESGLLCFLLFFFFLSFLNLELCRDTGGLASN